ncbi:hypothetical protein AB0N59_09210 [Microbacterium sp. NPDC089321]|uniref:hypothetical protein n=1 Tax=Microbacterium sp. NPDC089321 TaxID=3155183 RepID=UPI0034436851
MRVVVFAPTIRSIGDGVSALADAAEVTVLSFAPSPWEGARSVAVGTPGIRSRLSDLARRTPLGRVLRRLTPLDPGAIFAQRVRRSPEAQAAITAADLLVSTERDAQFSAWREARRRARQGAPVAAVTGLPAAGVAVRRLSDDS